MLKYNGCWQLVDSVGNPVNLYTKKAVAFIVDIHTGKEYRRGEYKLYFNNSKEIFPELIETKDALRYEFYYNDSDYPGVFNVETCAKELLINNTLKK